MRDMMEWGSQWLDEQLTDHAAQAVTYRRGEQSVTLQASVGEQDFVVDRGGFAETLVMTTFSLSASELVLSTGLATPQEGDQVWWRRGNTTCMFEVNKPAGDQQCYEAGPYRDRFRVFAKEIGTF